MLPVVRAETTLTTMQKLIAVSCSVGIYGDEPNTQPALEKAQRKAQHEASDPMKPGDKYRVKLVSHTLFYVGEALRLSAVFSVKGPGR